MQRFFYPKLCKYVCKFNKNQLTILRNFTTPSKNNDLSCLKETFEQFIEKRRIEANRSIIVQVSSEKSFPELYNYCSSFGNIIGAHHYQISNDEPLHYILLEYEHENIAKESIKLSCFNEDLPGVPVRSTFLWFKAGRTKSSVITNENLKVINGLQTLSDQELNEHLNNCHNLEDQINNLYQLTRLNDLGIRLRFLAAKQIESSICGMFPNANAVPFGSTVNGFGKIGCDLDLILRFENEYKNKLNNDSRLIFHTKESSINGRSQTQKQMECISDIVQLFLPGVSNVRRILQARVPIIKFHHEHLNLEVDLSMSNLTGAYMSELLFMFGQLDNRVQPLTFCLRRWAQTVGLTNPSPGRWISNFSLTCLIIFFLQQLKEPILPTINLFFKSATKNDIRITEDGINCTFLRDFNYLKYESKNTNSLSELLLQFYEFYSQFDFNNRAISLNEGRTITKPDHSAIYIVNPLETILNVSKNISLEECERFRIEVRNAAWILESESEHSILIENKKLNKPWGLLNLFKNLERKIVRPNLFFRSRMFEVQQLFNNNDHDHDHDDQIESKKIIEFKNEQVRNQVQNIKIKTKNDLNVIKQETINKSGGETIRIESKQKGRRR